VDLRWKDLTKENRHEGTPENAKAEKRQRNE
jgi:hypothetical protein